MSNPGIRSGNINFETQVTVPVIYEGTTIPKGTSIPLGFRTDLVVENTTILEIKAVAALLPAHETLLFIYLRTSRLRIGLLMNFDDPRLKHGLHRLIV